MTIALAPLTVTAGAIYPYSVGSAGTTGAVVVLNESPYGLNVSNGASSQWIAAQTADLVPCDSMGFNGNLTITTDSYLDNASSAPSFLVYFTVFAPGEPIRGTYPAPLVRLTNGGNVGTPSNTVEQDMWTPFILGDTITPSHTGNVYQTTTGVAFLRQSDNSLLRITANATSQTLNAPSTTYYHDLNPDGSFSLGIAHSTQPNYLTIATIVTNASGNITTLTDTRVRSSTLWNGMTNAASAPGVSLYNLHVFKDIQADDQISVQGSFRTSSPVDGRAHLIGPGSAGNDLQVTPQYNDALTSIAFWVNPNGIPPLTAVSALWLGDAAGINGSQIDSGGVIHAPAPVQLISGHQETGVAGYTGYAPGAGNGLNYIFNFKTVMTNVPTSLSSSNLSAPNNANSLGFNLITKYGANMFWSATAAGISTWALQYTTVGNCLLAIDSIAQTFDHHCDGCDRAERSIPVGQIMWRQGASPAESSASYTCSRCETIEHFNCALSAADEADTSPQGSGEYATTRGAQATLIRRLMTALGLEVAP